MIFKTEVRVRFSETDLAGWVYYGNYFVYSEVGRQHMYRELGYTYIEMKEEGFLLPIVEAHCEYKYPGKYDDVLEIQTKITEVREKSLKTEYEIYNKEKRILLTQGYCVQVCVDGERKSQPFPEKLKKKLTEALEG